MEDNAEISQKERDNTENVNILLEMEKFGMEQA